MLRFHHPENLYALGKEQLVTSIYLKLSNLIQLPDTIDIEFKCLGPSHYGETVVDPRPTIKRIVLNADLYTKDLFYPTIHELVHVHQMHAGRLSVSRTGVYIWDNQTYPINPETMSYQDYKNLPWEVDANTQQILLGKKLLDNQ